MNRVFCIALAAALLFSCRAPAPAERATPLAPAKSATPPAPEGPSLSDAAPPAPVAMRDDPAPAAAHIVVDRPINVHDRIGTRLVKTIRGRDVLYNPEDHPYLAVPAAEVRLRNIVDYQKHLMIVGGDEAGPGEFPWAAAVLDNKGTDIYVPHCGGALIAQDWILTAAHCGVDLGDVVVVGESDLNKEGIAFRAIDDVCTPEAAADGTYEMDVALLKLVAPQGNSKVLATEDDARPLTLAGPATAIGWGAKALGSGFELRLRKVRVDLIADDVCQGAMAGSLRPNLFCAGFFSGGRGICFGDSGGPLMQFDPNSQAWIGLGVAAKGCAQPNSYDLYTRVANVAAWIRSIRQPGRNRCIPRADG